MRELWIEKIEPEYNSTFDGVQFIPASLAFVKVTYCEHLNGQITKGAVIVTALRYKVIGHDLNELVKYVKVQKERE